MAPRARLNLGQDKHVVKAIVDLAVFLEFTGSSELDEDAAINAMEQLASELQCLDDPARIELSRQIIALTDSYDNLAHRTFVANLPEILGLS